MVRRTIADRLNAGSIPVAVFGDTYEREFMFLTVTDFWKIG